MTICQNAHADRASLRLFGQSRKLRPEHDPSDAARSEPRVQLRRAQDRPIPHANDVPQPDNFRSLPSDQC